MLLKEELKKILINSTPLKVKADLVGKYLNNFKNYSDYLFISKSINVLDYKKIKLVIISSYTADLLKTPLEIELFKNQLPSNIFIENINSFGVDIFDAGNAISKYNPDLILLINRLEEIFPRFIFSYFSLSKNEIENEIENILSHYDNIAEKCLQSNRQIIVSNFSYPEFVSNSSFHNKNFGQIDYINELNLKLKKLSVKYPSLNYFDTNQIIFEKGVENILNSRLWYTSKIPYTIDFFIHLAGEMAHYIYSQKRSGKKCLIIDLDNTIWGGIVGEDGKHSIQIGEDYPGNIYLDIQTHIKGFKEQGVLLAICSKNNFHDIKSLFDTHPNLILKWEDFCETKINWVDKSENIQEIVRNLNIGYDSVIFIDDSIFEIEMVKARLPEVKTIHFEGSPLNKLEILKKINDFDAVNFTSEDIIKTQLYLSNKKREAHRKSNKTIEEFYNDLEMELEIKKSDGFSLQRIHQLILKTNQFNLTTKRYSFQEVEAMHASKDHLIYSLRLKDKFGDNGVIGVVIIENQKDIWIIDSFLLSCRVLGRKIEEAVLTFIYNEALSSKVNYLIGTYKASKKNLQVADLYKMFGYQSKNGKWYLEIDHPKSFPEYISVNFKR
ncbi:MAG: HAD-IIIC family phosphatase [Rhodothermaceae bacterium]